MSTALARAKARLAARKNALTASLKRLTTAKKAVKTNKAKVATTQKTVDRLSKPAKPKAWMPGVPRDPAKSIGGFVSAPARGVLHTTEGSTIDGADAALKSAGSQPHFLVGLVNGKARTKQYRPLTDAATTLEHPPGTPETNRMHAIQIEVVGFAAHPDWPVALRNEVARVMAFCATQGVPLKSTVVFQDSRHVSRFAAAQWRTFSGWCGHQHVPNQPTGHTDPGAIDIQDLLGRAKKM